MGRTSADGHCLIGLTARQSQRVRDLAKQTLAQRGFEAAVYASHLELTDGRRIGLDTLGSLCHASGRGEADWPGIIDSWLTDLYDKFPDEPPPLTEEQLRAGVFLRLIPLEHMEPGIRGWYDYAPRIGGGFAEVLAHKDGDFVRLLNDSEVARLGYAELRALGLAHLQQVRPDECELVRGNGAQVHVVRGDSGFIASQLLRLAEIMRIVGGRAMRWPDGVLVAVPNRHELIFAPVDEHAFANLAAIAQLADYDFAHGHAPLMPVVYWWRDGTLTELFDPTLPGGAGRVPVEFIELLNRIDAERDAA